MVPPLVLDHLGQAMKLISPCGVLLGMKIFILACRIRSMNSLNWCWVLIGIQVFKHQVLEKLKKRMRLLFWVKMLPT